MVNMEIFDNSLNETAEFLKKIIAVKSLSGEEEDLMHVLKDIFLSLCDEAEMAEMPEDLKENPLYSNVKENISYKNRHNLILKIKGSTSDSIILNAHADTVPAESCLFDAYEKDGYIFGRGACDDKGQIAAIFLLLSVIKKTGIVPKKTLQIHIVAEEEIGGNGTLALMQKNLNAGLAIIMEPTGLKILTGSRGVVWFKALVKGISGHSGDVKSVKNALTSAVVLMKILEQCHSSIYKRLKGAHPFEDFENPMPLTFGKLHSGDWPATVPKEAVLEGIMGFLPGMSSIEVIEEINRRIHDSGPQLYNYTDIVFPLKKDSFVTSRKIDIVNKFAEAVSKAGINSNFSALPAFCDAWFYSHEKKIPSVIFGAGNLSDAHSDNERIKLSDIKSCALALFNIINSG